MYDGVLGELIEQLGRLPGVGPKSAQRMAFYVLGAPADDISKFAATLQEVKRVVRFCTICGNVTQSDLCRVCADPTRDDSIICVVEEIRDVIVIERTREFKGRYHVLGGAISPIDGVGPDDLRIGELLTRIKQNKVGEVIIATDPNLEGEATATYLARQIGALGVKVTRPASGLPVGGDLEFADEVTLGRAFLGRRPVVAPN